MPIFHTSLRLLIQPPNFQVPSVFVSSLQSNFSCFLGLKTYYSKGILLSDTGLPWWFAFIRPRWRLQQISSLSVQIVVTCRNNYHSVTLYCICFNP
ncbi:hypothetical protein SETIT_5G107400v2 [Setaria italica]|uniref:Uncharacterized protein n=1 Tax=Setaria italica TaxID=4555 RepID=A0A368R574_SETIT|nr:hypothetical protein SETIT_5G107400v2 [Setaria italica]